MGQKKRMLCKKENLAQTTKTLNSIEWRRLRRSTPNLPSFELTTFIRAEEFNELKKASEITLHLCYSELMTIIRIKKR